MVTGDSKIDTIGSQFCATLCNTRQQQTGSTGEAFLQAPREKGGREIRAFYQCAHRYFGQEHIVEGALQVILQGVKFLQAAEQWYLSNFVDQVAQEIHESRS